MLLPTLVCLFIATAHCVDTTTSNVVTSNVASNPSSTLFTHTSPSNAGIFAPLAAPIYRNVTYGDAWILPSTTNDLGPRYPICECYNPG
ncbi:hypothetical protein IMSHALPRED_008929, partial [Imshaugia aleurites]